MAIVNGIFGFESRDASGLVNSSNVSGALTATAARSGVRGFERTTGKFAILPVQSTLLGVAYTYYDYHFRVHFKETAYPNVTDHNLCGEGTMNVRLQMNTTGQIRYYSPAAPGGTAHAYGPVLSLGQWYRADFRIYGYTGSGTDAGRRQERISVYDESGALVVELRNNTQLQVQISGFVSNFTNELNCGENPPGTVNHGPIKLIAGFNSPGWLQARTYGMTGANGTTVAPQAVLSGSFTEFVSNTHIHRSSCQQFFGLNGTLNDTYYELGEVGAFGEPFYNFFTWNGSMSYGSITLADSAVLTNTATTYYDDVWFELRTGSDVHINDGWPAQTHILAFVPIAQGSNDAFAPSGAYARLADLPDAGNFVNATALGAATTYLHDAIGDNDFVAHIRLICNCWSSGTANHILLLGGVSYPIANVSTTTFLGNQSTPIIDASFLALPLNADEFAAMEFGAQHGTAASDFRLYNMLLEVLTGDSAPGEVAVVGPGEVDAYLVWAEFTDSAGTMRPWSNAPLPDPATYYGGWKDNVVMEFGVLARGLSDDRGVLEGVSFSWLMSDVTRLVRGLLSPGALTRYFKNRLVVIRTIDDANRRLLNIPRTIMRGFVSAYQPVDPLQFRFQAQDIMTRKFTGQTNPDQIPDRLLGADFPQSDTPPDIPTASSLTALSSTAKLTVPIVIGEVSDRLLVSVPGPPTGSLTLDLTGPVVPRNTLTGIGGTLAWQLGNPDPLKKPVWVTIVVIRNGLGGPESSKMSTSGWQFGNPPDPLTSTGVKVNWNLAPQAVSYRIFFADAPDYDPFGSKGSATKARYIDHGLTIDNYYPSWDHSLDLPDWTVGTDALAAGPPVVVDQGHGVFVPLYAGITLINTIPYHTFVVSRGACKSIIELYSEGQALHIVTDVTMAGVLTVGAVTTYGPWLVPGFGAWNAKIGTALYRDINGYRYTVIYGLQGSILPDRAAGVAELVASDAVPFAVNLQGLETIGDGSGTLITDVHDQYRHVLEQFVLQSYTSGVWAAPPTFPDDPTLPLVEPHSFVKVKAAAAARKAGGYVGGGIIGEGGESLTAMDLITRFNMSGDCDAGFNRRCQFMVSMYDDSAAAIAGATTYSNIDGIIAGTFEILDDDASHFNLVTVLYGRLYNGSPGAKDGWIGALPLSDDPSITNYSVPGTLVARLQMPDLTLYFIRDAATASNIGSSKLNRHRDPPRKATFKVFWDGFNDELGDILKLDHYGGLSDQGYVGQPMRLLRHVANPNNFTVEFQCLVFGTPGTVPTQERMRISDIVSVLMYPITEYVKIGESLTARISPVPALAPTETVRLIDGPVVGKLNPTALSVGPETVRIAEVLIVALV